MIVRHNIGPVKIGGTISRLSVGRSVPAEVLKHWNESGQLDALLKSGAVEDESRTAKPTPAPKAEKVKKDTADDGSVRESEG